MTLHYQRQTSFLSALLPCWISGAFENSSQVTELMRSLVICWRLLLRTGQGRGWALKRACAASALPLCPVALPCGSVSGFGDSLELFQRESVQRCAPFLPELSSAHILGFTCTGKCQQRSRPGSQGLVHSSGPHDCCSTREALGVRVRETTVLPLSSDSEGSFA